MIETGEGVSTEDERIGGESRIGKEGGGGVREGGEVQNQIHLDQVHQEGREVKKGGDSEIREVLIISK
jgi:hypothetical protein